MRYLNKKLDGKVGLPPGAIVYSGDKVNPTKILLYQYDEKSFNEREIKNLSDLVIDEKKINWIEISGFENDKLIMEIINSIGIHNIIAEDIFNMNHIPKFEEHDDTILCILKNHFINGESVIQNHCSVLLKKNLVISFQEYQNDLLEKKIDRISQAKGKARFKKADYMFFVLLDAFVDSYYTFFEEIREEINSLEDKLISDKKENRIQDIYEISKKNNFVRKGIYPLREAVKEIVDLGGSFIEPANQIYFRDTYDHINELLQLQESFTSTIRSLIDLNENNISNSMNEIMKMLTIVATIFIPLTFVAGIYGMNFEIMPELGWKYGYFTVWGVMILIAVFMIFFIRKKKWL